AAPPSRQGDVCGSVNREALWYPTSRLTSRRNYSVRRDQGGAPPIEIVLQRLIRPLVSRQLLQPAAGQQVSGGEPVGIGLVQLRQSGAGDCGRDQRAGRLDQRPKVLVDGLAGASRVGRNRRLADAGLRRESRQNGSERDVET